jgi:hypothetical protein
MRFFAVFRSRAVVRFYKKRGTAEQWIKEGKQAVKVTRLSCPHFWSSEVRLWLGVLVYNLGNLWRRMPPKMSWIPEYEKRIRDLQSGTKPR